MAYPNFIAGCTPDEWAKTRKDLEKQALDSGKLGPWTLVRCLPSPECQYEGRKDSPAKRNGMSPGHHPDEYRKVGYIVPDHIVKLKFPEWPEDEAHQYLVRWDVPITLPDGEIVNCMSYAAEELAILEVEE